MSWVAAAVVAGAGAVAAGYGAYQQGQAAEDAADAARHGADLNYRLGQRAADLSDEQWQLYKDEGLPILRDLAANRHVADRTDEEVSRAANDVKTQYANAKAGLERQLLDSGGSPADPHYAAAIARASGSEAADVARAITDARRNERLRVEETNWNRGLQAVQGYQGLPNQVQGNLNTASGAVARGSSANVNAANIYSQNAGQLGYGAGALLNAGYRMYPRTPTTPPPNQQPLADTTLSGNVDWNAAENFGGVGAAPYKGGGAIRGRTVDGTVTARRYDDGGSIRPDGSKKGRGFFGPLPRPDGSVSTELSFDFDADGRKILAPLLVPSLTQPEIDHLLQGGEPTETIYRKAQDHALDRVRAGKSPFAEEAEEGKAEGGPVEGPGTGTSDSISTRKAVGSYVLSADTVRAIGTKKLEGMMEQAGVRRGFGAEPDPGGEKVKLSTGEWVMPPEVVDHHGEEFFNKLQQKFHKPIASNDGMANGGPTRAIRQRGLPHMVESAILGSMPQHAVRRG